MDVFSALDDIRGSLTGAPISSSDRQILVGGLPGRLLPAWLLKLMTEYPLAGTRFELATENDRSGLGAELEWFRPETMLEEALHYYPGMSVSGLGYLPVAGCLLGSGDPYFLKLQDVIGKDAALVRVPHDFASQDPYPEDRIEIVSESLSRFFRTAVVYAETEPY